jgi:hypothetical protein
VPADEVPFVLLVHDSEVIGEVATVAMLLPKGWITFIDAGGRQWYRDSGGTLVRMRQKPFARIVRRRELRSRSLAREEDPFL